MGRSARRISRAPTCSVSSCPCGPNGLAAALETDRPPAACTALSVCVAGVAVADGNLDEMLARYSPATLQPGPNTMEDGEEIFFVPQPAAGLWAARARFEEQGAFEDR